MNRPQRNNNPLDLKFMHQTESTGPDKDGFAIFPTAMAGFRGGMNQIELDQNRGKTIETFIYGFAPPGENRTETYLKFIETTGRVKRTDLLISISKYALVGIMAQFEGFFNKEETP